MKKVSYTTVRPLKSLNLLSQEEILKLSQPRAELHQVLRDCALAILNTDNPHDDVDEIYQTYADFEIRLKPQSRGVMLEIFNAPAQSFVDGQIITGIQQHLSSVLRDIVYTDIKILEQESDDSAFITDQVFRILRNASVFKPNVSPNLVVCWGGHSIPREEYNYTKYVGYQFGLRGLDIITGCGIGAMKGPMKGAAVGHAKQQITDGRYVGISEPGIIASESPNAIVNELVIMPDIEKRLEAFVRVGHAIVVFPGGVGTVEEILYILSILSHPTNHAGVPLYFTGPETCRHYFETLDAFLRLCLGDEISELYEIIIDDAELVGAKVRDAVTSVHTHRRETSEAYYYNWQLHIDTDLQKPFIPTHKNMAALKLDRALPKHELASQLRSAFSGIVAGNVKAFGIREVAEHGPYQIHGEAELMKAIDQLLRSFVQQGRMKLGQSETNYHPCYQIVTA